MNRVALFLLLLSLTVHGSAAAVELSRTSTEAEIVESLRLPEGPVIKNEGTYLIEDGIVYKLIRGKRFRPRCIVKEMEEILPRVSVPGLFDVASVGPRRAYLPLLEHLGHALSQGDLRGLVFQIAGHTDGTGSDEYNHLLSQKRALWVKEHLEEKYGIGPERLHVVGLGATKPISSNITSKGRDRNRRIELRVLGISGRMFPTPCETSAGQE